jgi:hypothetical protein
MAPNLILSVDVRYGSDVMTFIDHAGKSYAVTRFVISNGTVDLLSMNSNA